MYEDISVANAFIDAVLEEMKHDADMKQKLDPLQVANFGEGSYEVSEGRVFGLLGFSRSGNSSLLYLPDRKFGGLWRCNFAKKRRKC